MRADRTGQRETGRHGTGRREPARAASTQGGCAHLPVLLVHGYGGCPQQWDHVRAALRVAGFRTVETFAYDAFTATVPALARRLARAVHAVLARPEAQGAREVILVGHSLGGVIVRYAVCLGGLDEQVRLAVTVAAPHGGCALARLSLSPAAAQLRPGSALLRQLETTAAPGHAAWIAYGGGADLVVSPERARLRPGALGAVNVEVPGEGHLSILRSRRFARDLVGRLAPERVLTPDLLALAA